MKFFIGFVLNILVMLVLDAVWLKWFAGSFFAEQLSKIGRFTESGDWDVRMGPAIGVYVLMSLGIEIFIFGNTRIQGLRMTLLHGAFLGLLVYGVFDLTNRAIIKEYPIPMVTVDMMWGTFLFAATTFVNFQLKKVLTLF